MRRRVYYSTPRKPLAEDGCQLIAEIARLRAASPPVRPDHLASPERRCNSRILYFYSVILLLEFSGFCVIEDVW